MKAIASVIANRARSLGVTPEQVVSNRREFNAYGKRLPAGVGAYRSLAQQALDDVAKNGPIHNGTFYATPSASGNLPRGLKRETATTGHIYYSDPQNRAIGTSLGYRQPRQAETATQAIAGLLSPSEQPATVSQRMGLLDAYSPVQEEQPAPQFSVPTRSVKTTSYYRAEPQVSLDTLRQQEPAQQMGLLGSMNAMRPAAANGTAVANFAQPSASGLLSQDVAHQRMIDSLNAQKQQMTGGGLLQKTGRLPQQETPAGLLSQDVAHQGLIDGLNAQKQQLAAGVNPMADMPAYQQPAQQPVQQPQAQPQAVQPSYEQTASVAGPAGVGGLLSAQERQMVDAQRASLSQQPFNRNLGPRLGNFAKGALGGVGGGLLGSLVGGPIGGLLGAALGKSLMNGKLNTQLTGFPQAPNSKSQGDGKENDYGRAMRESSRQYDNAVRTGSVGLY
jgi:hypothetical protein